MTHVPLRRCRVCRAQAPKTELDRWVMQDGQLTADPTQTAPGRGYYTDSPACAERLPQVLNRKK